MPTYAFVPGHLQHFRRPPLQVCCAVKYAEKRPEAKKWRNSHYNVPRNTAYVHLLACVRNRWAIRCCALPFKLAKFKFKFFPGELLPLEMRTERNLPLAVWTHPEDFLSARFAANFSPVMFDRMEDELEVMQRKTCLCEELTIIEEHIGATVVSSKLGNMMIYEM